ncbi:hypothetical protein PROFUN_13254 [Planoprotostelium fungivorum]|uniref:Mitochondrial fission process protein 1 n=1 Tax=Planoprotostelium fungivorum TaxID=1890364 RepID=A0A2P6N4Z6_9EUKA|nr:hypothetical protein PROFUN_13254 [Planoprotostelium fungivorum]
MPIFNGILMDNAKSTYGTVANTFAPEPVKPSPALVQKAMERANGDPKVLPAHVDSVESNARYVGYLARYRAILVAATRYLAFTSDVGEAFRPLVKPGIVKAAYGISWLYVIGDVSWEGHKAWKIQQDPTTVAGMMLKRAVFQGVASMALPALTIHSVVKYSGKLFSRSAHPNLRVWGPTVAGLATVPALPFMFDHPVERVVDEIWEFVEEKAMGRDHDDKTPAIFPGSPTYASKVIQKAQNKLDEQDEEEMSAEEAERRME